MEEEPAIKSISISPRLLLTIDGAFFLTAITGLLIVMGRLTAVEVKVDAVQTQSISGERVAKLEENVRNLTEQMRKVAEQNDKILQQLYERKN